MLKNFQVVTLSLYAYFFSALLGRQFITQSDATVSGKYEVPDMYFPFFTSLQVRIKDNTHAYTNWRAICIMYIHALVQIA